MNIEYLGRIHINWGTHVCVVPKTVLGLAWDIGLGEVALNLWCGIYCCTLDPPRLQHFIVQEIQRPAPKIVTKTCYKRLQYNYDNTDLDSYL